MNNSKIKPLALAVSTVLAATGAGIAVAKADSNPFGASLLAAGYMLDAAAAPAAPPAKAAEGKCGEGKCGEGKCGEGKGEHKHMKGDKIEGKCGEGKCGGDKKAKEGEKAKEGKCGGSI